MLEAHVVVATSPDVREAIVGPALYAVVTESPREAEIVVEMDVPPDTTVAASGGPLKPETAERLGLVPGEAKQIG
jgi:hypothetical protein